MRYAVWFDATIGLSVTAPDHNAAVIIARRHLGLDSSSEVTNLVRY